ncbi:MAG: chromosome segregation protein SMC [Idiomarina sp.]|nr:chromosome segregation protein SMC [Idiomarina sp.]
MRLKYIRLSGFKSFVDSTKVAFPEQMTCIVGPNGCGKSNVIDAVRWVLGESSAKNLRGDAMTDVIFNGSSSRKPVSQASVELVFDNTDGRLQGEFAKFNEVSVKRIVTRDAQSLYYLNGSKCRRRDITDLFLGTGLGPRSYAIIEQGMISRLIESRPQELRVFIEEAAGISKYKERRKETESRMGRTRENLERLTDVREELGQQLAKLQRQAAAARRYQTLKADERRLKSELQALKWLHYQQQCDRVEVELRDQETELERWLAEQRGSERGQTELRAEEQALQDRVEQAQEKFYQSSTQVTALEQQIRHERQLAQQKSQQRTALLVQQERMREELVLEREQQSETELQREQVATLLSDAQEQLAIAQQVREDAEIAHEDWQEQWQRLRDERAQVTERRAVLQAEQRAAESLAEQLQSRLTTVEQELAQQRQREVVSPAALQEELAAVTAQRIQAEARLQNTLAQEQQMRDAEDRCRAETLSITTEISTVKGRLASLEQLLKAQSTGDTAALEQWLSEQSVAGKLREILEVPESWQAAVECWLGPWLAAPVLVQQPTQWPAGFGAGLISLGHERNTPRGSLAEQLGALAGRISLLDGIAVASSQSEAEKRLADQQWYAVALVDGRIIGRGWMLERPLDADSQLVWQQQLEALQTRLAELNAAEQQSNQQRDELRDALAQQRDVIEQARQQLREQQAQEDRLTERLAGIQREYQQQQEMLQALSLEQAQLEERCQQLAADAAERVATLIELEAQEQAGAPALEAEQARGEALRTQARECAERATQMQQQLHRAQLEMQQITSRLEHAARHTQRLETELTHVSERLAELEGSEEAEAETALLDEQLAEALLLREQLEHELREAKEALSGIQEQLGILNQGQSAVLEQIAKQREKVEASKMALAASRERGHALLEALNELDVSLKEVLESMPEDAEEKRWQRELDETVRKVSQLGAINLAAIEEVDAQAERKAYLDAQHEDLTASLETLEDAIKKIDRETRTRFKRTYDQVNQDLQMLFPKVFGGGSAYLELTGEDLLETGVTIMARPPGKKNSTIHLLSGGEKALTALALVFAIFRLNPAPFCLLDEVDAPLDDVNVGRFCRLVQEMSESVQFIYISHNKIAMEMATHLAGVTMQEPGVSRLVAVDVDEAMAMAEAS